LVVKNPLVVPLLIVSLVAGAEAVALLVLLSRGSRAAPMVRHASLPPPQA